MLLEMVEVERLILPRIRVGQNTMKEVLEAVEEKGIKPEYIDSDTNISLGKMGLELLVGQADTHGRRLSVLVDLDGYGALVTCETGEEEKRLELVCRKRDIQLLVSGSHGSSNSCSKSFLDALGAESAVLSLGFNYQDCPAEETLERLELCGYNVYRTDFDGTVEMRISE